MRDARATFWMANVPVSRRSACCLDMVFKNTLFYGFSRDIPRKKPLF